MVYLSSINGGNRQLSSALMPTIDALTRQMEHHIHDHSTATSIDANAVAEAAAKTWRELAFRLSPIIGVVGMEALFKRSLHLTNLSFPWLSDAAAPTPESSPFSQLYAGLKQQGTIAAIQASEMVLIVFTELLGTLIGVKLTRDLLLSLCKDEPAMPQDGQLDHELNP